MKHRFGIDVDPLRLNAFFRDNGIYIDVDDKIRDDLSWWSFTRFNPEVVVLQTGTSGWPKSNNALVKFKFKGSAGFTTHFCMVEDWEKKTIVDSWDGLVKSASKYGEPIGWAVYGHNKPQPVSPVAPAQVVTASVAPNVDLLTVQPGWGISHCLKNRGYPDFGNPDRWNWLAQQNGVSRYQDFKLKPNQQITCPVFSAPPAAPAQIDPVPTPEPVKLEVAVVATGTPSTLLTPQAPVLTDDFSEDPEGWKASFKPVYGKYVALRNIEVLDLEGGKLPSVTLPEGTEVHVGGKFEKDGVKYYQGFKHARHSKWYGIPASALRPFGKSASEDDSDIDQIAAEIRADLKKDDISLVDEAREFRANLTKRETLVAIAAKIYGALLKLKFWRKRK